MANDMNPGHYSTLIPPAFRHKDTKVRVLRPQVILLDFHGTLCERKWEDKVIFPYTKQAIGQYVHDNWTSEILQSCIPALRNESFEQRFRYKYDDAPVISDPNDQEETDQNRLAQQVADFLLWQITTRREIKETQIIERLVWVDGFRKRSILTPIFDDVLTSIKRWKEEINASIHVISSIDSGTLKLLLENTDKGNLDKYISGYISSQKTGDKLLSSLYKQFYDSIKGSLKNIEASKRSQKSAGQSRSPPSGLTKSPSLSAKSPSLGSQTSEIISKPVLFLTDSGQEAKAANQVADGSIFECLLINRPGNKRIRTYYLSRFQYIDRFDDIEFV